MAPVQLAGTKDATGIAVDDPCTPGSLMRHRPEIVAEADTAGILSSAGASPN
jgi:hypothetical protein